MKSQKTIFIFFIFLLFNISLISAGLLYNNPNLPSISIVGDYNFGSCSASNYVYGINDDGTLLCRADVSENVTVNATVWDADFNSTGDARWLGGSPSNFFNQNLNTTDDVTFNKVTTPTVYSSGIISLTPSSGARGSVQITSSGDGTKVIAAYFQGDGSLLNNLPSLITNPFDQSLNTTDDVLFTTLNVNDSSNGMGIETDSSGTNSFKQIFRGTNGVDDFSIFLYDHIDANQFYIWDEFAGAYIAVFQRGGSMTVRKNITAENVKSETLILSANTTVILCAVGTIYYDGTLNMHRACNGSWNDMY